MRSRDFVRKRGEVVGWEKGSKQNKVESPKIFRRDTVIFINSERKTKQILGAIYVKVLNLNYFL